MRFVVTLLVGLLVFVTACSSGGGAAGGQLRILTTALPEWEAPGAATYKLEVAGGTPPYQFAGAPPQGFNIGPDGTIGGLARLPEGSSRSESAPFIVTVTDSKGATTSASFTIKLVAKNTLQIITVPVRCVVNQRCDEVIATASDGYPPYSFQSDTFANGAPPFGTIVDVNGHLTGRPSRVGESSVGVCATDKLQYQRCGQAVVTITAGAPLAGNWSGPYTETETLGACALTDTGNLTFILTVENDSFTGTLEDVGVTTSPDEAECGGGPYELEGTVDGTVSGDSVTGTMRIPGDYTYELPFTATMSNDTLAGTYAGTGTFASGSSTISDGAFTLVKES